MLGISLLIPTGVITHQSKDSWTVTLGILSTKLREAFLNYAYVMFKSNSLIETVVIIIKKTSLFNPYLHV